MGNRNNWTKLDILEGSQLLHGRSGHASVIDECNIYIYGGYSNSVRTGTVFQEVWVFNLATRTWLPLKNKNIHKQAASASFKRFNNTLFLYGGTGYPFGQSMSNSLHVCSIDNKLKWEEISVASKDNKEQHRPYQAYGQSTVFKDGYLYVFGGAVGLTSEPRNDLHRLLLSRNTNESLSVWECVKTIGEKPEGRYKAELVLLPDKERFILLGGGSLYGSLSLDKLFSFAFATEEWSQLETIPDDNFGFPKDRSVFGCCQTENVAIICGGRSYTAIESMPLADTWKLDLQSLKWNKLNAVLPVPLFFHTMNLSHTGELYIFGGVHHDDLRSNKIYCVRLGLFVAKLADLAWETYTRSHKKPKKTLTHQNLAQQGVPCNFFERLPIGSYKKGAPTLDIQLSRSRLGRSALCIRSLSCE